MKRKTSTIPKATVARILMQAGAKRVSASAVDSLSEVIKDISMGIATRAAEISRHAGRKTVKAEDIRLAARR